MHLLARACKEAPGGASDPCARAILDGLPAVMWFIRHHMRGHRAGLSVPQFRALVMLDRSPTASLSELADYLGCTQPSASRLVSGLVTRGLVMRKTCEGDRRQCALLLSARGRQVLNRAMGATLERLADETRHLNENQRQMIVEAMGVLQDVFARPAPDKTGDASIRSSRREDCPLGESPDHSN